MARTAAQQAALDAIPRGTVLTPEMLLATGWTARRGPTGQIIEWYSPDGPSGGILRGPDPRPTNGPNWKTIGEHAAMAVAAPVAGAVIGAATGAAPAASLVPSTAGASGVTGADIAGATAAGGTATGGALAPAVAPPVLNGVAKAGTGIVSKLLGQNPWMTGAGLAAGVGTALINRNAANNATQAEIQASRDATAAQLQAAHEAIQAEQQTAQQSLGLQQAIYNQNSGNLAPYRGAGASALGQLGTIFGVNTSGGGSAPLNVIPQGIGNPSSAPVGPPGTFTPNAATQVRTAGMQPLPMDGKQTLAQAGGAVIPMQLPDGRYMAVPAAQVNDVLTQGGRRVN